MFASITGEHSGFSMMYGWHSEFGITGIGRFGETVDVGLLGHGLWLIGAGVRLRHDGIGHGRGLG